MIIEVDMDPTARQTSVDMAMDQILMTKILNLLNAGMGQDQDLGQDHHLHHLHHISTQVLRLNIHQESCLPEMRASTVSVSTWATRSNLEYHL